MRRLDTRSKNALFKAMLLVWLAWFGGVGQAGAENREPSPSPLLTTDPGGGIQVSLSHSADPMGDLDPRGPYLADTAAMDTPPPRADLYTLTKLAVDELEFLAGIRFVWDRTERRVDSWARKLKLKGDISIAGSATTSTGGDAQGRRFNRPPPATRSISARPSLSLRSIFIPRKIRWRMGFDPTDQVAFGALQWGPFISLNSDVGAHQEVWLEFKYTF
jgi:hypothetical protein